MRFHASVLVVALLVSVSGCDNKQEPAAQTSAAEGTYLGSLAKAQKSAVKTIDVAALNNAIQMFAGTEGRYPADLNELVKKKHMPELPPPPHGMKFDYDAKTGTVKVVPQ
jgi:hypothetical protein